MDIAPVDLLSLNPGGKQAVAEVPPCLTPPCALALPCMRLRLRLHRLGPAAQGPLSICSPACCTQGCRCMLVVRVQQSCQGSSSVQLRPVPTQCRVSCASKLQKAAVQPALGV